MAEFLGNIRSVAITALLLGLALFAVFFFGAYRFALADLPALTALLRWAHVLAGIMWIGHLYYFNFTQTPNIAKIPEQHRGPSINKVIAPAALYWFRWGAVFTLLTGLLLAYANGYLADALTLGALGGFSVLKHAFIGIGMWLAIVMFLNVWLIIWPSQQRVLNIDDRYPDLSNAARAVHGKRAMMASRVNTLLSAPMLVAMTGAQTLG